MTKKTSFLTKCQSLLEQFNPRLAYQLVTVDPTPLEFCKANKELNLKRTYEGKDYYYHSTDSPSKEAEEWFNTLGLKDSTLIYVYGIGLGYYYEAAKSWLKKNKDHVLVFLEEDLAVLHRLFETERGVEILKNSQVHIYHFINVHDSKTLFNELSWTYIFCPFTFSALKLYAALNPDGFSEISHQLSYDDVQKQAIVKEYLEYGISFFKNFYHNMLQLPLALRGNKLFGQFENIPAIICGAGPSLHKNISTLKTLKDKAVIFGGGSALNALSALDCIPHFGCGVDPNQAQFERVILTRELKVPFFYRNRLFADALNAILGPRLYLTGTGGYEISEWFEKELGIEGEILNEGNNVVNFCLEIAKALGCNPIIFVGVDLALTDQKTYAEGVIEDTSIHELKNDSQNPDFQSVQKVDIHGKPIQTLWKWIVESDWISDFAEENPDLTLINATEGGLGFKNVPNQTLKEAAAEHLQENKEVTRKVEAILKEDLSSGVTLQKVKELMAILHASLSRCLTYIEDLTNEMKEVEKLIKQGASYPASLQTHKGTLIEMNLEEEIGFQYILNTFNIIYMRVRNRTIQTLQFPRKKISEKSLNLKKIELHLQRLTFLHRTTQVNLALITMHLNANGAE